MESFSVAIDYNGVDMLTSCWNKISHFQVMVKIAMQYVFGLIFD